MRVGGAENSTSEETSTLEKGIGVLRPCAARFAHRAPPQDDTTDYTHGMTWGDRMGEAWRLTYGL